MLCVVVDQLRGIEVFTFTLGKGVTLFVYVLLVQVKNNNGKGENWWFFRDSFLERRRMRRHINYIARFWDADPHFSSNQWLWVFSFFLCFSS